jgi:DNA helicase IV
MQNIFGHYSEVPNADNFFRYRLTDNLRNTKSIVRYINKSVETDVKSASSSPDGSEVIEIENKNNVELIKNLKDLVQNLTTTQKLLTSQLLILISDSKVDSPIATVKKLGKFQLKSLDRKGRFEKNTIYYTNIKTFKGLEQDVLIILKDNAITQVDQQRLFYTQASRAKHSLYILTI